MIKVNGIPISNKQHCKEIIDEQKQPPEVFYEKDILRNFAKFTGKHLCQSVFFNKVVGLRPATFFKKRLWQRCFPENFAKFLRTSLLQNTSGPLLLDEICELICYYKENRNRNRSQDQKWRYYC